MHNDKKFEQEVQEISNRILKKMIWNFMLKETYYFIL